MPTPDIEEELRPGLPKYTAGPCRCPVDEAYAWTYLAPPSLGSPTLTARKPSWLGARLGPGFSSMAASARFQCVPGTAEEAVRQVDRLSAGDSRLMSVYYRLRLILASCSTR
jgi:hypothetical protein